MDAESLAQVQQIVTTAVTGLRQEFAAGFAVLRQEIATTAADLRQEMRASAEEVKRHTGVLFEDTQHKLELVVEGMQFFRQSVVDVRAEIAHESRETRALLKLSYEQLHRRVENLEHRLGPAS